MHSKTQHFKRLTVVRDNLIAILAWVLSVHISIAFDVLPAASFYSAIIIYLIILPIQVWVFNLSYRTSLRITDQFVSATQSVIGIAIAIIAFDFVAGLSTPRTVLFVFAFLSLLGLVIANQFVRYWYFHSRKEIRDNYTKVLLVGSGPRALRAAEKLTRTSDWGTQIIGYIDPDPQFMRTKLPAYRTHSAIDDLATTSIDEPIAGSLTDIESIIAQHVVDEVLIAVPRGLLTELQPIVDTCQAEGIRLRIVADLFDIEAAKVEFSLVDGVPIVDFLPVSQSANTLILKRMFDLVLVLAAVPLLVPIFFLIAIAVKVDSRGPIFFKQERIGLNKRRFMMFKFRSMSADAEIRMAEIEHLNEADGPIFKIKNDPRVTRVGRFIRRTSLDELPQLINVVMGHMSLVGPRPMSLRDVNLFDKSVQRRRFSVRPGCTCLWQISGRSELPFDKWLELDLQYIEQWSLLLDLKILCQTIPTVIKGSGAS